MEVRDSDRQLLEYPLGKTPLEVLQADPDWLLDLEIVLRGYPDGASP
jgi:hypothetical protein